MYIIQMNRTVPSFQRIPIRTALRCVYVCVCYNVHRKVKNPETVSSENEKLEFRFDFRMFPASEEIYFRVQDTPLQAPELSVFSWLGRSFNTSPSSSSVL